MRVAGAESIGDGSAGLVEHDTLPPDRPLSGEGPVVEVQPLGDLVGAAFVEGGAGGDPAVAAGGDEPAPAQAGQVVGDLTARPDAR